MFKFFSEYYLEFEPNLDASGIISLNDYMYIYSLFIHFSCVKYPKKFFHRVSMNLNDKCQEAVAQFLNIMMQNEKFDRSTIRDAIYHASPAVPRLSFVNLMSNLNTPKGKSSPPTPTGVLLDHRMREIKMLKAQLDSEKYERGCLEVQCQQYEDQMIKLKNEREQYQMEIERLKSDLVLKGYTEKETRKYLVRIQDLELTVTDQQTMLQDRDDRIKELVDQVNDLEFHLQQVRDSVPREILDSSGDLLDFSMNQSMTNELTGK